MIWLLLGLASAECDPHRPIAGSAGYTNAIEAVRTNANTYGAGAFARNRLRGVNVMAMDMHEVFGAAMIPSICDNEESPLAGEIYAQPLDLAATNLGFAAPIIEDGPANLSFRLFYAASVTTSSTWSRWGTVVAPMFNLYPALVAPAVGSTNAQRGVGTYAVDWIGGATLRSDVVSVQAGYTGTKGLYLDVTQEKVAVFFNTVFGDGLQISDLNYLIGGVEKFDPAASDLAPEEAGMPSLFYRSLPQAVSPEGGAASLRTVHLQHDDLLNRWDVRLAASLQGDGLREAAAAFHTEGWHRRKSRKFGDSTEGYLRVGVMNLPDQPLYGVNGGIKPTIRGDIEMRNDDSLSIGLRMSVRLNDPELLDLYPFAYNALGANFEMTWRLEDP